jgi:hypothetical protein
MSKSVRKIFKLGRAHVITLPPDWVKKVEGDKVIMLYDRIILILPEDDAEKVEEEIEKTILRLAGGEVHERKEA